MKSLFDAQSDNKFKNLIFRAVRKCLGPIFRMQDEINKHNEHNEEELAILKKQVAVLQEERDFSYLSTMDYLQFENRFRGPREAIMENQKIYLEYFLGRKNVLDLGCGRGEFVELLQENNIGVKGYDLDSVFIELCVSKGLNVEYGDALKVLSSLDKLDKKCDGIFMSQVIEHMKITDVLKLCRLAYARLEEGAYFIMETPNPRSLSTFANAFYIDPTHNKPVHPELLRYFVEISGFKDIRLVFTESSRKNFPVLPHNAQDKSDEFNSYMYRLNELIYGSQDYAIIARR